MKEENSEIVENTATDNKKKGKKGLICVLVAIIILLAGATCYFAFIKDHDKEDKDSKSGETIKDNNNGNNNNNSSDTNTNNNDNDNKPNTDNTTKEVSSDEISAIMKKFNKFTLMELIYGNSATFTKDKLTDIQLNMLETYMIGKYSDEWQEHFDDNSEWSFSKTEADNYFQELYNFKPSSYRDVMCGNDDGALLYFKGDKFIWNDDHPGHGGYTVNYIDYYVSDSSVTGNSYALTISFLYGHEEMGYYINGVSIDGKVDYESEDDYDKILALYKSYFNKNKDEYKNKGYKFTFEKKNGNYYLKSFSK